MLQIDDIKVGMIVTVLKGQEYTNSSNSFGLFGNTATATVTEDNSYKGDVLRVEALALPYVCLVDLKRPKCYGAINLDLRKWKLMKLPQDYIDAMLRDKE